MTTANIKKSSANKDPLESGITDFEHITIIIQSQQSFLSICVVLYCTFTIRNPV